MADFTAAITARLLADAGLSAAVGDKVHWVVVPQDTALPYVRMQVVSDPRPDHLKGSQVARVCRVQVDCFAKTHKAARDIAQLAIAALAQPATFSSVRFGRGKAEGPRDLGEDTEQGFVHRAAVDLLLEHDGD